eukprot:CAMPEP_0181104614 /NCGR_PEP_ID=MMETSP1071-20121207/15528_1 /TAXON_ID=35127 /ORGANISM="Thalassiosira sp., Strain NH16" /LENGTH=143 /DNA_ID=CAMNT_0023187837 /DNA_START=39 /DNA_END=469 /DNA_ORIENTATION=-
MSFSGAIRRTAQRLSSVDWSSPVFKGDHDPPVDFASAKKSVRDVALVDALEKMYSSSSPPAQTYEWSADDQASKAEQIEEAKAGLAFTQEMIEDTQKEIAYLRVNKTTRDTYTSDLKEVYPDIADEVETEIEKREWFTDTLGK